MGAITDRLRLMMEEPERLTSQMNEKTSAQTRKVLENLQRDDNATPVNSFLGGLTTGLLNKYLPSQEKQDLEDAKGTDKAVTEIMSKYNPDNPLLYKELSEFFRSSGDLASATDFYTYWKQSEKTQEAKRLESSSVRDYADAKTVKATKEILNSTEGKERYGIDFDDNVDADALLGEVANRLFTFRNASKKLEKSSSDAPKYIGDSDAIETIMKELKTEGKYTEGTEGWGWLGLGGEDSTYNPIDSSK